MIEYVAWFFGGALAANGVPHFVAGVSGRAFPTPFARFYGRTESTAWFNVIWAALNLAGAYALVRRVGMFDGGNLMHVGTAALGALLLALAMAVWFGKEYGGNRPGSRF